MTDFHGDFGGMTEEEKDLVIQPKHYKLIPPGPYPEGIEYTGLTRILLEGRPLTNFQAAMLAQVIKYLVRAGFKDEIAQDYRKMQWYLQYLIDDLEGNQRP